MKITRAAKIINSRWRFDPDTGFLRCTAGILKSGVMLYTRADLDGAKIPEWCADVIRLNVSQAELEDADGLASLEASLAVVGHTWQAAGSMSACGSVCGAPVVQGSHLLADLLITDPEAVRRIMLEEGNPQRLTEISSAGDWTIVWEPGTNDTGEAYDGYFTRLRFNHVALLPVGAGRAGASVRIINEKEAPKMEFTRVQIRNKKSGKVRHVRVANEDVSQLEEAMVENEEIIESAITPEQLQAALEELAALKEETAAKNERIAELEGMIQSYKDQLDEALSDANVEAAAAEMAADVEEATAVMNAHGLQMDAATKKLRGNALRTTVLNSVRVKNGKSPLSAEEAKDASLVKGMYKGYAETAGARRPVAGAEVVTQAQVQNSNQTQALTGSADRMARLYPKAEGK